MHIIRRDVLTRKLSVPSSLKRVPYTALPSPDAPPGEEALSIVTDQWHYLYTGKVSEQPPASSSPVLIKPEEADALSARWCLRVIFFASAVIDPAAKRGGFCLLNGAPFFQTMRVPWCPGRGG